MKIIIILIGIFALNCQAHEGPLVKTEQGLAQGQVLLSRDGREYYSFLQMPYGKAKRFQAPVEPDKYNGIHKTSGTGPECAQNFWFSNIHMGIEDCLNLHVYSPEISGNLPVMVFFHGGGFSVGTSNVYHEKYFMDEDVVLVMVNYRLGPFGFLSTGDDVIPGNYGLKDQNQALKWIQKNIRNFGGNPGSVTIFGNSAGGASVNYHILSPMSKGLFQAAVSHSGSALNPWAFSPYPANMAKKLGEAVNCAGKSSRGLLNCLLGKSTEELLEGMKFLVEWGYDPFTPFGPVVEPKIPGSFLTADPEELLRAGKFNRVPWISGIVQDEGHMMHSAFLLATPELSSDLKQNWRRIFPITLEFNQVYHNFSSAVQLEMAEKIYEFYFKGKPIDENTRQELTDVFSDRFFNHGVTKAMLLASKHTPVYPYIFTHNRGDYTLLNVLHIEGNYGVSHGDELTFLFDNFFEEAPEFEKGSAAEHVSKNLVKLWVSFARNKVPTALWGSQKEWPPMGKTQGDIIQFYKIDTDTALVPEHFTSRIAFWEEILNDAGKESQKNNKKAEL